MSDYLPEIVERVDEEITTPSPDNITAEITDTVSDEGNEDIKDDEEIITDEVPEE